MRLLLAVVVVALTASAASAGSPLDRMTLPLSALPPGFVIEERRYRTNDDVAHGSTSAEQIRASGRVTGYKVTYTQDGDIDQFLLGVGRIDTHVSVYRSARAADSEFRKFRVWCRTHPRSEIPMGSRIGDESHLCWIDGDTGGWAYHVIWRRGNLLALVTTAALTPKSGSALAVRVARLLDSRMR